MSKLNFSKGKFGKFLSSKGFYVAIAACLVGAGAATWLAVDNAVTGIEDNNNQMIESGNQWNNYPKSEEVDKKQPGIKQPGPTESSASASSSQSATSSSAQSAPSSKPSGKSAPSAASAASPSLVYALPVKSEIIQAYSGGELVRNLTLNDWRTHDGIDLAATKGMDVMAAADGTVSNIVSDPLWGTVMTISHIDGVQTVYCGLDKALPVKTGDAVLAQQVIGKLEGSPCEISLPSHLHFAVQKDGKWSDPLALLQKQVVGD